MTNTHTVKFVVCPACEGEGHFGAGIVYTAADLDESFGDDWDSRDSMMQALREGVGGRPCDLCRGARVVTPATAQDWEDGAEYRAEEAAERRYFGG
jgi:hypothetical protein